MRVAAAGSTGPFLDQHQTLSAARGLAAAANRRAHFVSVDSLSIAWELSGGTGAERVIGNSLGLSTCVALLSNVSKKPAHTHVAGTASVDASTGALGSVQHLSAKLEALHAAWPEVTHVVVATEQPTPENAPLQLIRCADVAEAVTHFGLDIGSLPKASIEELEAIVKSFERQDAQLRSLREWAALAANASEVAVLLRADRPEESVRARIWAALFASHSADNLGALEILKTVDEHDIEEDVHRAMYAVVLASTMIDEEPLAAADRGAQAVLAAEPLKGINRARWYGRAKGTHGRALMHAGKYTAAEPLLRAAYEHHDAKLPEEAGRSACYLASCLRHAERLEEALRFAELAQRAAETAANYEAARSTRPYACLERARVLMALGRPVEAVPFLGEVIGAGDGPHRYPRLGAHRTLATVYCQLGRLAEAEDQLRPCWEVARDSRHGKTARRLGVVAAAEEIEDASATGRRPLIPTESVDSVWTELFGDAQRRDVLKTWIY